MSKTLVTKVDIHVSDDGGECDPTCPFLQKSALNHDQIYGQDTSYDCLAFHKKLVGKGRTIGCQGREDCTYQIPVVEE